MISLKQLFAEIGATPSVGRGRVICFEKLHLAKVAAPRKRDMPPREAVIEALKARCDDWHTVPDVAFMAGICRDTAIKVLNRLASEHLVAKRRAKCNGSGRPAIIFKWINKHAKKQKTA